MTPYQYVLVNLANTYGLDKSSWEARIEWAKSNKDNLWSLVDSAEDEILFISAIHMYETVRAGEPTGKIMGLDATASGLQIMACLTCCDATARNVNVVNTGHREDIYQKVADGMGEERSTVKKPVMTTFYGSKQQPMEVFGESDKLEEFYNTLEKELPGAIECMDDIQSCWQSDLLKHEWHLPDGHLASVNVMVDVDARIEIDELLHGTFTHRVKMNQAKTKGLSLAANIIHSIDGWIVREMIRMANVQGFELLSIHDSFWASPNYMQDVRENYNSVLFDIAKSDLLQDILREITRNSKLEYVKQNTLNVEDILESDYSLS
jgi:hypothetical protein